MGGKCRILGGIYKDQTLVTDWKNIHNNSAVVPPVTPEEVVPSGGETTTLSTIKVNSKQVAEQEGTINLVFLKNGEVIVPTFAEDDTEQKYPQINIEIPEEEEEDQGSEQVLANKIDSAIKGYLYTQQGEALTPIYAKPTDIPTVDTVTVTPVITQGTKIADIQIGNDTKTLYIDLSGKQDKLSDSVMSKIDASLSKTDVTVSNTLSGVGYTKIATINIAGVTKDLYVDLTNLLKTDSISVDTGSRGTGDTVIATIKINGVDKNIYIKPSDVLTTEQLAVLSTDMTQFLKASNVTVSPLYSSGVDIATITVGNTPVTIKAPTAGESVTPNNGELKFTKTGGSATTLFTANQSTSTTLNLDSLLTESEKNAVQSGITKTIVDNIPSIADLQSAVTQAEAAKSAAQSIKADLEDKESSIVSQATQAANTTATTVVNNAINALDVSDIVQSGQYVSGVSQTDGKIVVQRSNLPTIPTVYNGALKLKVGTVDKALFTANQQADVTLQQSDLFTTAQLTAINSGITKTIVDNIPSTSQIETAVTNATNAATTATNAATQAQSAATTAVETKLSTLDVNDTEDDTNYVSSVTQTDGKIQVKKKVLPSAVIKESNKNNNIKFWVGTLSEYTALGSKDSTTLYYIIPDV